MENISPVQKIKVSLLYKCNLIYQIHTFFRIIIFLGGSLVGIFAALMHLGSLHLAVSQWAVQCCRSIEMHQSGLGMGGWVLTGNNWQTKN